MQGGFYVISGGRNTIRPDENYPRQQHPRLYHFNWSEGRTLPEFALIMITTGGGKFESQASGSVNLRAGQTILLFPGLWHRYQPDPRTGWTEKWIHFNGPMSYQLLDQQVFLPDRPVVTPRNPVAAEHALDNLLERIHGDTASNSLLLSLEAAAVLAQVLPDAPLLASRSRAADSGHQDAVVIKALDYIWTRSHTVLSVSEVTTAVGVNRRRLERHLRAALGHSVLDEIINCRFSRAERLLRSTDLPLESITVRAGFGSKENMRQVFMTRTGMSPAAYRQHHQPQPAKPS